MGRYDDIINLPRPVSKKHRRMPVKDRAAQFAPFAALSGYEESVRETARRTESFREIGEEEKAAIDEKLRRLAETAASRPVITMTYFKPDKAKSGGAYVTITGTLRRVDRVAGKIIMLDRTEIAFGMIFGIELAEK